MLHTNPKFIKISRQASHWFSLLLFAGFAGKTAAAQILSLAPGQVTAVTATSSTTGSSAPNYTGAPSGLLLNNAQGLTYDSQGDLFIVDGGSNVVRVIASGKGQIPSLPSVPSPVAGTVYTVAGSGSSTPSTTPLCGSDEQSPADNLYYGNGCPATDAILDLAAPTQFTASVPNGQVALDASGNLYIPDVSDNQVRVVFAGGTVPGLPSNPTPGNIYGLFGAPSQTVLSTLGTNNIPVGPPTSLAVDPFGDVWIVYGYSNNLGDGEGIVGVVVGAGNAKLPQLVEPGYLNGATPTAGESFPVDYGGNELWYAIAGIASDSFGNIYITDGSNGYSATVLVYAGGALPPAISADLQSEGQYPPIAGNSYYVAGMGSSYPVYGQGVPAPQAITLNPAQISLDSVGDFYTGIVGTGVVVTKVDPSGNLALVSGPGGGHIAINCAAAVDGFGDGCPANQTASDGPYGVAPAPDGSIDYTDVYIDPKTQAHTYALHKIDGSASSLQFPLETAGLASSAQVVSVANVDTQPLNISAINLPNDFAQVASGGVDCSAPTTLAAGQTCELSIEFLPVDGTPAGQQVTGELTITSNSNNASSGVNSIAVSGIARSNLGTTPQTVTFPTLPSTATYGQVISLQATASSNLTVIYEGSGPGRIQNNMLTITGVGPITVTAYQPGNQTYAAATPVPLTISAQPAPLTVTAGDISQARTLPIPSLASDYTIAVTINGTTTPAPASATTGTPTLSTMADPNSPGKYPINITQNTLSTTTNIYSLTAASFVTGTFTVLSGQSQTIAFTQTLPTVTYSATPINLLGVATATSGLPVTYNVAGPATLNGSTLTLTGAGTVTITANQAGNATYAAAPPASQSFTVQPATLTFTPNNLTMAQGSTVPALTYTIGGLVNGDAPATIVSGTPTLATTATSSSPAGTTYPITIARGSVNVSSNSYTLTSTSFAASGTMTVVTGSPQTISFGALPNVTYGVTPFGLSATSDSGLPVTFTVSSGPASITNNVLTVTVTATQGGNATYTAAKPVSQSLTVAQASLTITANNITRVNDTANPPLTYTITGLLNGDTAGVLSGVPVLSTTATPSSPPGTYPIAVASVDSSGNPITAGNYTINPVPGTFTITSGGPVQAFTIALSPQSLTILAGRTMQTTLSVTSVNYYQGVLNLSCTGLPASVSCIFSPAALTVPTVSSSSYPAQGTLTISTSNAAIVGSLQQSRSTIYSAAITGWVSLLFGGILAWQRKRLARYKAMWTIAMSVVLLGVVMNISACGSSSGSSTSGLAAPGTSTIQVVATDSNGGPSNSTNLVITIQ